MRLVTSLMVLTVSATAFALRAEAQPAVPVAQPTRAASPIDLALGDAITRAIGQSEEVRLAQVEIDDADTRVVAARAEGLPQLNVSSNYNRMFRSALEQGNFTFNLPPEQRFSPDPTRPLDQRVAYLEQNADKAVLTTLEVLISQALQGVGVSSPHMYSLSVSSSQLLYGGGRVRASVAIMQNVADAARFNYQEQAAEVEQSVRTAYYRALLAQELETIAQAAIVQAESFLNQTRLRRDSGFASDLDVLRAEVSLENLRPQLVEASSSRQLAELNLKRLTNLPLEQPVRLTTPLEVPTAAALVDTRLQPQQLTAERPAVQAANRQVAARARQVEATRGAYKPAVQLQVSYGGQLIPQGMFDFTGATWQALTSASVGVQIPVFNGYKRGADIAQARVLLRQTELNTARLVESVQLQYEQALGDRERARATIAARQRTVDQAQRGYDLTVLSHEQGQSSQLEVSTARLSLLQARSNFATALSDFYVANAAVTRATGATTAPVPPPTRADQPPRWWAPSGLTGAGNSGGK